MRIERIGNATLYLGDCRDVLPTLADVQGVVTDPPYAIMGGGTSIAGRGVEAAFDAQFFRVWFEVIFGAAREAMTPDAAWWMTIDWRGAVAVEQAVSRTGYRLASVGVWDRGGLGMGYALRKTYENFLLIVGDGWKRSATNEPDVWRHEWYPSSRSSGHQAEKPVPLMERAVKLVGGDLICDPFMGSGTTGVACANLGKPFVGIELDPTYFETACRRISDAQSQANLFAA